jgi:hypothetical protein
MNKAIWHKRPLQGGIRLKTAPPSGPPRFIAEHGRKKRVQLRDSLAYYFFKEISSGFRRVKLLPLGCMGCLTLLNPANPQFILGVLT